MKQKNIYLSCILLIYGIFDGADVFAERSVAEFYTNHEVSYHLYIDILSTKLLVFSFPSFYEWKTVQFQIVPKLIIWLKLNYHQI